MTSLDFSTDPGGALTGSALSSSVVDNPQPTGSPSIDSFRRSDSPVVDGPHTALSAMIDHATSTPIASATSAAIGNESGIGNVVPADRFATEWSPSIDRPSGTVSADHGSAIGLSTVGDTAEVGTVATTNIAERLGVRVHRLPRHDNQVQDRPIDQDPPLGPIDFKEVIHRAPGLVTSPRLAALIEGPPDSNAALAAKQMADLFSALGLGSTVDVPEAGRPMVSQIAPIAVTLPGGMERLPELRDGRGSVGPNFG